MATRNKTFLIQQSSSGSLFLVAAINKDSAIKKWSKEILGSVPEDLSNTDVDVYELPTTVEKVVTL